MIRAGYDQTLTIPSCKFQYLYQGKDRPGRSRPDGRERPVALIRDVADLVDHALCSST